MNADADLDIMTTIRPSLEPSAVSLSTSATLRISTIAIETPSVLIVLEDTTVDAELRTEMKDLPVHLDESVV